jgi:hypothetical protein
VTDDAVCVRPHRRPERSSGPGPGDTSDRQVLSEEAQAGIASWIDGGALLIIGPTDEGAPTVVSGVSPLTGGRVQLGVIDGNRGCGWSRTHLVCVTVAGIKVWRFAT